MLLTCMCAGEQGRKLVPNGFHRVPDNRWVRGEGQEGGALGRIPEAGGLPGQEQG